MTTRPDFATIEPIGKIVMVYVVYWLTSFFTFTSNTFSRTYAKGGE